MAIEVNDIAVRFKLLPALVCLTLAADAHAASVSLVPTTPVDEVLPGDIVTFDIVIDFAGESTMGGGLDITFDPAALQVLVVNRDPVVGEVDFSRDPDILTGLFESWAVGAFGSPIPDDATLGSVSFEVLAGLTTTTVVAVTATSGIGGPWISGVDFLTIIDPAYNPIVVHYDTDGDGTPNAVDNDDDNDGLNDVDESAAGTDPLDPDSDDDGIGDALDDEPLAANNFCSGAGAYVFTESVVGPLTCAATTSIAVVSLAEVLASGNLHLIAPIISFESGFTIAGLLTVTSADPCPGCSP